MKKTDVLIIGNGIAGLSCAEEIRKNNKDLSITIVGKESYPTYYRVKLTKTLSTETDIESMLVKKETWYKDNKIELILNQIVEELDELENKVKLDGGKEIEYKKLVLATGSKPFIPPVPGKFRRGVFALRDFDDLNYIKTYINDLEEVAVIGGGLLGLEAAWALKELGKKVHIIEMAPNILPRQLNLEMSKRLEDDLKEEGFILHLGVGTKEIYGDDAMEGIELDNGTRIEAKSVLFSVGVRSNIDLLVDTGIETNRGIVVDKNLKTNIDNIYATGDVIEFNGMSMGLWTSSMAQGKVVGKNILGENLEYEPTDPFTTLKLGQNINIFSIGENSNVEKCYGNDDIELGHSTRIFTQGDIIVGGILYGDTKSMQKLKKAVESGETLTKYIEI